MIMPYNGKHPEIELQTFVAPTAVIIGAVRIMKGASIWYGTVIRGDKEPIVIGENTNIQDNCTVHTDDGQPAVIGSNVSIGHNAVVHGCCIEDNCLVGIGAVVLSGATIGRGSVIAAGSVVREGQEVGSGQLVAGTPARFKRKLTDEDAKRFLKTVVDYKSLRHNHAILYTSKKPAVASCE